MKKSVKTALLTGMTLFTLASALMSSFAWYYQEVDIDSSVTNIDGRSAGAFFAYGTGTVDDPYGIKTPKQLSNLAWLQYSGYFAHTNFFDPESTDSSDPTVPYPTVNFELAQDVDCTGWEIPPIGTEDNPFIGYFDGQGYDIKNLTVTNASTIARKPNSIVYSDQPEIVGLFGVVGSITDGENTQPSHTYSSAANQIINTGIDNLTVISTTESTLVGMAAGYVNGNISNVAVNNSTIDIQHNSASCVDDDFTENLSDYGVVGYATQNYRKDIKRTSKTLYDVSVTQTGEFNASEDGDSQGWGGSINMKTIYQRLYGIKHYGVAALETFTWKRTQTYYNDNLTNDTPTTSSFMQQYHGYNNSANGSIDDYVGNFVFLNRNSGTTITTNNQWMYLSGGHWESKTYNTYYDHVGFRINNGANNSLTVTNFADSQAVSDAAQNASVVWQETGTNNNVKLYTTYNNTPYYLQVYNTTSLRIRTNSGNGTTFAKQTDGNDHYRYVSGNYYLGYDNGWKMLALPTAPTAPTTPRPTEAVEDPGEFDMEEPYLRPEPQEPQEPVEPTDYPNQIYYIDGSTYRFLVRNGNNFTASTTPDSSGWTYSNNLFTNNGNNRKLRHNNNNLGSGTGTDSSYQWTYSGNKIYYETSGWWSSTYYLRWSGNNFQCSTTNSNNTMYYGQVSYYNGSYMTTSAASTQYSSDLTQYNTDHASWVTDHGKWVNEQTAYNAYVPVYNAALAQYNSDLAAYNAYVDLVNQWNNYDSLLTQYNTLNAATYTHLSFVQYTAQNPVQGPDSYQTQTDRDKGTLNTHMYYTYQDTTYFPLNVEEDGGTFNNKAAVQSAITAHKFNPKVTNTGYITAGSDYEGINSLSYENNRDDISKVRISEYARSNIEGSFDPSSTSNVAENTLYGYLPDSSVYTINMDGDKTNMGAINYTANNTLYPRYADSKKGFMTSSLATKNNNGTYNVNDNVYGLHFMGASIDSTSIVNARKVSVLGAKSQNYQMPVNAVNFNLKQKGVVNFFAGTYFTANNSFFSLHEIVRNNDAVGYNAEENTYTSYNTISEIKEIEEIWSNDVGAKTTKYSNIYKYKGKNGTEMYSVPYRISGISKYQMNKSNTTDTLTPYTYATMNSTDFATYCSTYGYTLKFKTDQIDTDNEITKDSTIFYFEFPMNPGEYALGSVDGGTGAYLLYLDIGANAAKTQRTTAYEYYIIDEKLFYYPNGVALVATSVVDTNITNEIALDETDTSNAVIYAGYKGQLILSRTGNDVTMTRTGSLSSAKPTLVGDNMWDDEYKVYNVHKPDSEGGANISSEIVSAHTITDIRRLAYYDFNVNTEELTKTFITDTSTDGGTTYTRTFYQEYQDGSSTTVLDDMAIYNFANGSKYIADDISNANTSDLHTYSGATAPTPETATVLLTVDYVENNGVNMSDEWVLNLKENTEAKGYYVFQDYVLSVEVEAESVTIVVIAKGSKKIYINGTEITAVGQSVTISAS